MVNHPATVNVAPSPQPQPVARYPELLEAFKAMQAELQEMKQTLANHSLHNSLNEVNQRAAELTQREKDCGHHMHEFTQPMAKYHAMDMCDMEHAMRDCIAVADLAVPVLTHTFRPSGDEDSDM